MKKMTMWLVFMGVILGSSLAWGEDLPDLAPGSLVLTKGDYKNVKVLRTETEAVYEYTATVKNIGSGDAASFYVAILKSKVPPFSSSDEVIERQVILQLGAGESVTISGTVSVSADETYHLGMWIDPDGFISEKSKENNFSDNRDSIAVVLIGNYRSGDPCGKLVLWQGEIVSPELWNGQAEHDFSPAQYLAFSAKENQFNLVSLLVILEYSQKLVSVGQSWDSDFEYRLLETMNYGSQMETRYRWYGFVPQCVGTSYQFMLEKKRGRTFQKAFLLHTGKQGNWQEFRNRYVIYGWFMNYYLGTSYKLKPNSDGYYLDFSVTAENQEKVSIAMQKVLEVFSSPLQNEGLFQEKATPSLIRYNETERFCQ